MLAGHLSGGNDEIRTLCRVARDCVSAGAFSVTRAPLGSPDTVAAQAAQAPIFEVDPFWPKPLPNHWVTGSTIGLSVDAQDNVWTIHRPETRRGQLQGGRHHDGDAEAVDDEVAAGPAEPA